MKALIIAGIGDDAERMAEYVADWPQAIGVEAQTHAFGWGDQTSNFDAKFAQLLLASDEFAPDIIIGVSAGASAMVNLASVRPGLKLISVCGRLKPGGFAAYPYYLYQFRSPAFIESVRRSGDGLATLTDRMLVLRPRFDELIPVSTSATANSEVIIMPVITHGLGIKTALTMYSQVIADFARR